MRYWTKLDKEEQITTQNIESL